MECHPRGAGDPTLYPVDSSEAERSGTWPQKKPQESWQLAQAPPAAPGWAGLLWLAAPCLPDCDVVGEVFRDCPDYGCQELWEKKKKGTVSFGQLCGSQETSEVVWRRREGENDLVEGGRR